MKIIKTIAKFVLSAILIMPILGTLGVFPAPTADMYTNPDAFTFIQAITVSGYIMPIMAVVFFAALISLWTKREALAGLLLLPVTLNIVGFHAFLDGGLLTSGALMGNILLVLNLCLLWHHKDQIVPLLQQRTS